MNSEETNTLIFKDIQRVIDENDVVLFLKGDENIQYCGFSIAVTQMLRKFIKNIKFVNVLENDTMRQNIKKFSDWPTIPQLYVKKEFIGGHDIIRDMFNDGSLEKLLQNLD